MSGFTTKEIAKAAVVSDEDIIRARKMPIIKRVESRFCMGSLSPKGSVVKQSAVSLNMMKYKGVAKGV